MLVKRFSIVPELSSAARMPLPSATRARAVLTRASSCAGIRILLFSVQVQPVSHAKKTQAQAHIFSTVRSSKRCFFHNAQVTPNIAFALVRTVDKSLGRGVQSCLSSGQSGDRRTPT